MFRIPPPPTPPSAGLHNTKISDPSYELLTRPLLPALIHSRSKVPSSLLTSMFELDPPLLSMSSFTLVLRIRAALLGPRAEIPLLTIFS